MAKANVAHKILEAGLEALYQKGFNATSVQDITQAAGVPKGSFYNHFESKEALGVEVVNVYASRMAELLAPLGNRKLSPSQRLLESFKQIDQSLEKGHYLGGCMLGNFAAEMSDHSEPIRQQVDKALNAWCSAIADTIKEGQDKGKFQSDVSSEVLAVFLLGAWEGAVLRARVMQNRAPIDAFFKVSFAKILS